MLTFLGAMFLVFVAVLTQAPDPSTLSPLGQALYMLAPAVIGYLATLAYDGLKTVFPFYDRLPAIVHQVAAPLFAFLAGWLSARIGYGIPTDLGMIDADVLNGILTTLANGGIFRFFKRKAPADGTRAVEATRT